jgi:hypothetical protein
VTLRRLTPPAVATAATGLAATFDTPDLSRPLRRTALAGGRAERFRLRVPVRGLRPGRYVVEMTAAEHGTTLGTLRMSRSVQIR